MTKLFRFKFFILATYLLFGCEKNDFFTKNDNTNIVNKEYASEIAEHLSLPNEINLKSSGLKRKIQNIDVVYKEQIPLYYIINYKDNGGFVVLSADKRCMPILAYSDKGFFNKENISGGLRDWIERSKGYVEMMKADTSLLIPLNRRLWLVLNY